MHYIYALYTRFIKHFMNTEKADKTIAQMNIRLPANMKQAIKASVSMAGVPLKQVAQDALLFYFDSADESIIDRRANVVNAFKDITKKNESTARTPVPNSSAKMGYLCW